jgi:uncharacterized protein (DUF302 family)
MKYIIILLLCAAFSAQTVAAENGLVHVKSAHDVKTTADKLETVLKAKGMTLFNRINHAAGAQKVGRQLRPTELVIFGNPKVGSPLMACQQTVGIDLPQKALIWQDEAGQTWVSYNRPAYLQSRHQVKGCDEVIAKVTNALENFAKAATRP